jgi:hypothetical protein
VRLYVELPLELTMSAQRVKKRSIAAWGWIALIVALVCTVAGGSFALLSSLATAKGSGVLKAGFIGPPASFTHSTVTQTTVKLTWTAPTAAGTATPTGYHLTQSTGTLAGCSATPTASTLTCTATGLTAGKLYTWTLTAKYDNWSSTSVSTTATTTAAPTCGVLQTRTLAPGATLHFTLLGGGGGKGGNPGVGIGTGGAGATLHGTFVNHNSGTVKVLYEKGCAGTPGGAKNGGLGAGGYAAGGKGGTANTTNGGGGGGGGGATEIAIKVGSKTTVIAVVGGGGGGGGTKTSHHGTAGGTSTTTKSSSTGVTGGAGTSPPSSANGYGSAGGGGGGGVTPGSAGGGKGLGGTGGFNYKHNGKTATAVTSVTVTLTTIGTGTNGGSPGNVTFS